MQTLCPKDFRFQVWFYSVQWLIRTSMKCEKFTDSDNCRTDDRQWMKSDDNTSHGPLCSGEKEIIRRIANSII